MRYIVIPIAIILYLWWSYKSIRDLRKEGLLSFGTVIWLFVTLVILSFIVIFINNNYADNISNLFIKYW